MEVTWFDLVVGGLMLISGLLALMRGFTREITSLVAWGGAALAAFIAIKTPELVAQAQVYIKQDLAALIAVGAGVFLIVLIILSLISIRFTDWLLDSSPGAFDRSLGFLYGLTRGLAVVMIAYLFYIYFFPENRRLDAIRTAKTLPAIEQVSLKFLDAAEPLMGSDLAEILKSKTYTYVRKNGSPTPVPATPGASKSGPAKKENGYNSSEKKVLDQLIENTQNKPKTN